MTLELPPNSLLVANSDEEADTNEAALLSEMALAEDWDRPEEDAAWSYLQQGPSQAASRRSVTDVLAEAPGHVAFQTAEAVDAYLREERESWEQ